MKRKSFAKMECSIARALEVVGEWWSLLIVRDALNGIRRFEDFQARLGVARNVLTARLRRLVEQGVLERVQYQERPARFEYVLTEKGADLFPVIVVLMRWGDRWAAKRGGAPVELCFRDTGEVIDATIADAKTRRLVQPRNVRARPGPGATKAIKASFAARAARDAERTR